MTDYEKAVQKVQSVMAKGKGEMGFPLEESRTKQQKEEDLRKLRERLDRESAVPVK